MVVSASLNHQVNTKQVSLIHLKNPDLTFVT